MDDFRVGDIVECVDASPLDAHGAPPIDALVYRALYTVREVTEGTLSTPKNGVRLAEVTLPRHPTIGKEFAWWAGRFRKIHRPRAEFLTELLSATVDPAEPLPVRVFHHDGEPA